MTDEEFDFFVTEQAIMFLNKTDINDMSFEEALDAFIAFLQED